MINLENLRLEDIAPDSIKIPDVLAFFNALDPELQEITQAIAETLIMTRIDELPEYLVDLLAWQLHVDFYEPLGLDLDRKRALVKNSLIWHRYKGTKYVLEDMIRILFFDNFKIEEWFEYGGKPYFFRLISHDILTNPQQYNDLIRAIYQLKNERSWLEGLIFYREAEGTIHIGITGKHSGHFEVDGYAPESKLDDITVHYGIVGRHTTKFFVIGTFPDESYSQPADTFVGFAGRRTKHFTVDGEGVQSKVEPLSSYVSMAGKRTKHFTVDGENTPSAFAPADSFVGVAGKTYKHSIIDAEDVATHVPNAQASTGMAHRHISKTFIDSEEVENGNI